MSTTRDTTTSQPKHRARRAWYKRIWIFWTAGSVAVAGIAFLLVLGRLLHNAAPIVRERIIATLSAKFNAPVELDALDIRFARGIEVEGGGLRIPYGAHQHNDVLGTPRPLIVVRHFSFHTRLRGLLHEPTSLALVTIDGMEIHIPPPKERAQILGSNQGTRPADPNDPGTHPHIAFSAAEIQATHVKLFIESSNPAKEPREFDIATVDLHGVGPGQAMQYVAVLTNPIPRGIIHAAGHFGPWNSDDPQQTPVDGSYTFDHADLGSIKGIGGDLSSKGTFGGLIVRMTVDGTADVPNFSLDTSNHPVPLNTVFHAIVDGTNGDTELEPVQAQLLRSRFTCRGIINNLHGQGHDIALDVDMPAGRIEDMLQLAVKTDPPLMRGTLRMKAKLHIPPGKQRVPQKLQLAGDVHIQQVRFSNPKLQDKIDGMSLRAQGRPGQAKEASTDGTAEVASAMSANFDLANGMAQVADLRYQIPGALVLMNGVYSLNGEVFEFKGHVRTDATLSQMTTGWVSTLLKPISPFFRRNGAGTEVPIEISGTKSEPHFGLAMHGSNDTTQQIAAEMRAKRTRSAPQPLRK